MNISRMKMLKLFKKFILWEILGLLITNSIKVYSKELLFSLLEKTRKSEFIILAKCIEIKNEKYIAKHPKITDKEFEVDRFAVYKIIETWKGKYNEDALTLDYKFINKKYEPFLCRPITSPRINEQVILFLEKDFAIFTGCQGKIDVEHMHDWLSRLNYSSEEQKRNIALLRARQAEALVTFIYRKIASSSKFLNIFKDENNISSFWSKLETGH